jgi:integrase
MLHVNPAFGGARLDKVSPTRLAKLYADLQRPDPARKRAPYGLSKNSVHKVHVALSAMFEAARDDNLLGANPARKRKTVKAPTAKAVKRDQAEMSTWTGAQLRAFLTWNRDAMNDDAHALWWVARTLAYAARNCSRCVGATSISTGNGSRCAAH